MNRHENLYHRSGRWLVGLFILWVAAIVTFGLLPSNFQNNGVGDFIFTSVIVLLFVAIFSMSVLRMVSYMRWTGRYPFYFLFRKSRKADSAGEKEQ